MGVNKQAEQYSYWIEYFQIAKNKVVRNFFNNPDNLENYIENPLPNAFDDMMVKKVTNGKVTGEVERVTAGGDHSFRKDIVNIANYFDTKQEKLRK